VFVKYIHKVNIFQKQIETRSVDYGTISHCVKRLDFTVVNNLITHDTDNDITEKMECGVIEKKSQNTTNEC